VAARPEHEKQEPEIITALRAPLEPELHPNTMPFFLCRRDSNIFSTV